MRVKIEKKKQEEVKRLYNMGESGFKSKERIAYSSPIKKFYCNKAIQSLWAIEQFQ